MSEDNYGSLMLKSALSNSVDLKNVSAAGIYPVTQGNATAPSTNAGLLKVIPGSTSQIITFKAEDSSITYTLINGSWEKNTAGDLDAYTKAESDALYVQGMRQSGIMTLNVGSGANTQAAAGGVVIGARVNGDWDNNEQLKYTWLQQNINGEWVTIGRV
ncbi:TPA: hypothetical protein R4S87_001859 [Kluyvera cryocrescens]|nr:hypothetical protein [Kluyvera cryocrescens]